MATRIIQISDAGAAIVHAALGGVMMAGEKRLAIQPLFSPHASREQSAPLLTHALALLHAFGGNVPDWLRTEYDALAKACADAEGFPVEKIEPADEPPGDMFGYGIPWSAAQQREAMEHGWLMIESDSGLDVRIEADTDGSHFTGSDMHAQALAHVSAIAEAVSHPDAGYVALCRAALLVEELTRTRTCPQCEEEAALIDPAVNTTHQQWECPTCGSWNDRQPAGAAA